MPDLDGYSITETHEFWVIWNEHGIHPPRFKHYSEESAMKEASRLAAVAPGRVFYVLKGTAAIVRSDLQINLLLKRPAVSDEVPF